MNYWLKLRNPDRTAPGQAPDDLDSAKEMFKTLGVRIVASGLGLGGAYWVVADDSSKSVSALREKLGEAASAAVEHVELVVAVAEGQTLARQLPLFH